MNNRFSALNEGNEHKKKINDRKKEGNHENIFRQKSKHNSNQQKNEKTVSRDKSSNQFIKHKPKVTTGFDVEKENFPTLITKTKNNSINSEEKQELSYSEKIKKQKAIQAEKTILKGWMVLTQEAIAEVAGRPKQEKEINEYYNVDAGRMITESRRQYREELNNILGDISPYWDIPIEIEDEEDNDSDIEAYSEDEEQEYVDENW